MRTALRTEALTNGKPDPGRVRILSLTELDGRLADELGKPPRRDRLERADRGYRWVVRKMMVEGPTFDTSYAQIAAGLGYSVSGDRKRDFRRFHSRVERTLGDLALLGLIRWGGVKRPNGAWRCLRITVLDPDDDKDGERSITAAKCQPGRRRRGTRHPRRVPVRQAARNAGEVHRPYRAPAQARRIFFGPEVGSPLEGSPTGNRERGLRAREGPGSELSPWIRQVRERVAERFRSLFGEPRLSATWAVRLARALRRLDRYADFGAGRSGAGAELLEQLLEARHEELAYGGFTELGEPLARPRSLAYFAPEADEISKDWRRHVRRRQKAERAARNPAARSDTGGQYR